MSIELIRAYCRTQISIQPDTQHLLAYDYNFCGPAHIGTYIFGRPSLVEDQRYAVA
jgi:hypothetical protein